jgi:hypothetical protein
VDYLLIQNPKDRIKMYDKMLPDMQKYKIILRTGSSKYQAISLSLATARMARIMANVNITYFTGAGLRKSRSRIMCGRQSQSAN